MVFGVADKDGAIGVDPDAVGASEAGGEGTVAVGAVGEFAHAHDGGDELGLRIDDADGVVFGVDEVDAAVATDGETFRAGERGGERGAVVAGEAFFAGAGEVVNAAGGEVEAEDLIAFAGGEPEVPGGIEVERARAAEGCADDG